MNHLPRRVVELNRVDCMLWPALLTTRPRDPPTPAPSWSSYYRDMTIIWDPSSLNVTYPPFQSIISCTLHRAPSKTTQYNHIQACCNLQVACHHGMPSLEESINLLPAGGNAKNVSDLCHQLHSKGFVMTGAGRNVLDCVRFYSEQVSRFWLIIVVI